MGALQEKGTDTMLLIVWHSRTGTARAMAQAAFDAAREEGEPGSLNVRLMEAGLAQPADCLAAQGFLFVCPENLGGLSGVMKEFFDRCYYPLIGRIEGRAYATAIAAGTAGQGAQGQIDRIVTGWRLRRVAPPCLLVTGADRPETILADKTVSEAALAPCRDLGRLMAAGLGMGAF